MQRGRIMKWRSLVKRSQVEEAGSLKTSNITAPAFLIINYLPCFYSTLFDKSQETVIV